jgi:hypothetical protein
MLLKSKAKQLKNTLLGALTADAASLGFHWIYDQQRIHDISPSSPEFHSPSTADYEGVPSYFAHGKKNNGDLSHYGEQALTLLRSLSDNEGGYSRSHYQQLFCQHFGYGGDYNGYIDRPMRDSLDNITTDQRQASEQANAIDFDGDDEQKQKLIALVTTIIKQNKSLSTIEQSGIDNKDLPYAKALFQALKTLADYHGADDEQLPAIAKLPALAAIYAGDAHLEKLTESAVRVTNNNDRAVAFGQVTSKMIETAILTQDIPSVIEAARQSATAEILTLIDQALGLQNKTTAEVTKQLGMNCNLECGIPSVIHNLSQQNSFAESIKQNIYAGGDSCGRAILLGAVLGNIYGIGGDKGIPQAWINKLGQKQTIEALLNTFQKS